MLSKVLRPNTIALASTLRRTFGTNPGMFHRVFNTLDKKTSAY